MAERHKSKRVKFPKGKQQQFILKTKNRLNLNWENTAKLLNISVRQLTDWRKEKFLMPLSAVKVLCKKSGVSYPHNMTIRKPYWYVTKGARKGGLTIVKKYGSVGGDPKKRLQKWHEWWREKGRFQKHPILGKRLSTKKPRPSVKLAEFVGIMLGDGGISQRQVSITLNRETDKEYIQFVKKIIIALFGVSPSLYPDPKSKADTIVISRTELVEYLTQKLGLKIGNKVKQQIDIPTWIKKKSEYKIACVRGLVDTDGSVYKHSYTIKNKTYSYKKLSFCSLSPPLLLSVFETLKNLGLKPRICKDKEIKIENTQNVRKYFEIIGSNNKKHLKKIKK